MGPTKFFDLLNTRNREDVLRLYIKLLSILSDCAAKLS